MNETEASRSRPDPARPGPGPSRILLWGAWFGLVAGLAELAIFLLKCHLLDPRNYNASRHLAWMYPAAGLMVSGGPALSLATFARARPGRLGAPAVLGSFSFLAYLGVLFRCPIYTAVCLILATALAARTGAFLGRRPEAFGRLARRSLAVLAFLVLAVAAASQGRGIWSEWQANRRSPQEPAGSRNVILIVLDTVRARSLGLYGYPRDTTPNLARIAARGVRFDLALATAPWTAPSHASMFTGRWPGELSVGWNRPLDRSTPTLAEYLGDRGYATAGFVANTTYCSYETGLDRGFGHYEDYDVTPRAVLLCSSLVQRALNFLHKHPKLWPWRAGAASAGDHRKDSSRIHRDFFDWADGHRDRPFFAFLNDFDAHHPYFVPEPADVPAPGRRPESLADFATLRDWWDLDKRRIAPADVELARDSYDRCIAHLDRQVGGLFDGLERRDLLRETLVIITADHGEHLGEHRLFGHGCSLYLPELHVPLIVLDPGAEAGGRVVHEPVSLRDLPATVVERLGLGDGSPFPGRSLARTWSGPPEQTPPAPEPILSELAAPPESDPNRGESPANRGPMRSIIEGRFHYIRDGLGREELYQIEDDPDEVRDLAESPELAPTRERFRRSMERVAAREGPGRSYVRAGPPSRRQGRIGWIDRMVRSPKQATRIRPESSSARTASGVFSPKATLRTFPFDTSTATTSE